ncbi:cytoplasmic dynein 2 heavy chain 1-like [Limulus polyphemus]|uniref:Cytoplasmic dynein 2 heavy chain 1-like n=1 Tax=Limulus polyphemus TaxID=6850 RepID=A0ABM1RWN1_LIMPO|nr:cytoplasmic dynein 2 heavy chain 1-like [Limulus polyphemus]
MDNSFKGFEKVNPLQYNPYTDILWKTAVAQHERELATAEHRVAEKLRSHLHTIQNNALQLMQEFKRYEELVKRPSIKNELTPER